MDRIVSVVLPRAFRPAFPRRCVVCGKEEPGGTTRVVARDGSKGAALWAGWFSVHVPCCRTCGRRLQLGRAWRTARTLVLAGLAFAFGIVVLLPRLPGWGAGLITLGLICVLLALQFLWNRWCPPAFEVDPHDTHVEYEFRDVRLGEEFARHNDAS